MEKQLTAMMILREKIISSINEESTNSELIAAAKITAIIDTEILSIERQNIINAVDGFPIINRGLSGEDYYEQTFKTQ